MQKTWELSWYMYKVAAHGGAFWSFVVTLTFDLFTLAVSEEEIAWYVQRPYQFWDFYDYLFLSYVWLDLITYTITWNGHFACAVSRDLSPKSKNDPHFWSPWPKFTHSLCHFQGATTKFKRCYMPKIAFIPLSRLQSSPRRVLYFQRPPPVCSIHSGINAIFDNNMA